jgi:ABC-type spermidine/putrescine transport system permease subunit II
VHNVTLASSASTAALTVGLAAYAGLIFVGIAVAIYDARRNHRGRAIAAAVMVGLLTLGGLIIAIVSSVV